MIRLALLFLAPLLFFALCLITSPLYAVDAVPTESAETSPSGDTTVDSEDSEDTDDGEFNGDYDDEAMFEPGAEDSPLTPDGGDE